MSNQNIYDNETFFEGYKSLRAGETNYNDLLEQPAMAKMLRDLTAKDVLDLGCGYGHNCCTKRPVQPSFSGRINSINRVVSAICKQIQSC